MEKTEIKLGRCIAYFVDKTIEFDQHYENMVELLNNALADMENTIKSARRHNVDNRITEDLSTLYNTIYSMYDKYYTITYESGK